MPYRILLALLYYFIVRILSISCKGLFDGIDERAVVGGLLHEADDRIRCSSSIRLGDPSSDEPYRIEFFGLEEEILSSRTGLINGNRREDPSVCELPVERNFRFWQLSTISPVSFSRYT